MKAQKGHTNVGLLDVFVTSEHLSILSNKLLQVQAQVQFWPFEPLYHTVP